MSYLNLLRFNYTSLFDKLQYFFIKIFVKSKSKGDTHMKTLVSEKLDIAQLEIDSPARFLLPQIQKFFESEEGRKKFEEWKKKREMK